MQKKLFLPTYLPYFLQAVTGNKQFIFLGFIILYDIVIKGSRFIQKYIKLAYIH